jgi:uncharacterized membrane protein
MMRYLEYAYLLGTVAIAIFMAMNFKDLPTSSKVVLSLGAMLCAFMYSFRRKQRQMMEEMDRRSAEEQADAEEADQSPDDHGH